ncbi:MAG: exodeoxyribonuclease III [Candidatus Omnitrophota bacterium]
MKNNKLTFLSWNVNGIRAIEKKGFLDWFKTENPDFLCLQETKAHPEQLSKSLLEVAGYRVYWNQAQKKGYSGVAIYTRFKPDNIEYGFNNKIFDQEGRVLILEYQSFVLINIYFPNGGGSAERLKFKLDFYQEFFKYIQKIKNKQKKIIICGDLNTAHNEIDLARPKENSKNSGFLPEERALIDQFIELGFVDTFRFRHKDTVAYSWWDYKTQARQRNIGWRLDYFFINDPASAALVDAFILKDVFGSDHCPVGISLKI